MKGSANLLPARGEKWARLLRFEGQAHRERAGRPRVNCAGVQAQ
jgi:hypothetical protein